MADEQLRFDWADGGDHANPETASAPPLSPLPAVRPLAETLRRLAAKDIFLGTSSWKYPGWLGRFYDPGRYQTRGKLSNSKFERNCLGEYATVFPTVGGDFAFYQFPSEAYWQALFEQAPPGFKLSLKIPEDITVERFPDLPRYGKRAGTKNPDFMSAAILRSNLLDRLVPHREKLGVLMFEFGTIHTGPMAEPRRFTAALGEMLEQLPTSEIDFAVEIRNPGFLATDSGYFESLRRTGVAHCFNSWTRMPTVNEQMAIPGAFTAGHVAARFLLRPGRAYQEAVASFSPYDRVREPYAEGRLAMQKLIEESIDRKRRLYAFVNNRFEGNAIDTIEAVCNSLI